MGDPASTTYAPHPGGKRRGVMALFFAQMHCDPHTWGEHYVCRDSTCVGVGKLKSLPWLEKKWETLGDCQTACGKRVMSVPNTTFPNAALRSPALRGATSPSSRATPAPARVPVPTRDPLQLPFEHLK